MHDVYVKQKANFTAFSEMNYAQKRMYDVPTLLTQSVVVIQNGIDAVNRQPNESSIAIVNDPVR